jgi:hypothetical protein
VELIFGFYHLSKPFITLKFVEPRLYRFFHTLKNTIFGTFLESFKKDASLSLPTNKAL